MSSHTQKDPVDKLMIAQQTNSYVTDNIKFADAKVAGLIALTGAITTLNKDLIFQAVVGIPGDCYGWMRLFFFCGIIFGLFGTFMFSLCALGPRTKEAEASLSSFPD